jgi:hypothetical protein
MITIIIIITIITMEIAILPRTPCLDHPYLILKTHHGNPRPPLATVVVQSHSEMF